MKKIMFLMMFVVLLAVPMTSYAESAQECASNCVNKCESLGSGKEYATCLENCLKGCYGKPDGVPDVPPPKPANPSQRSSEINNIKIYAKADTVKCAHKDKLSGDSCCQNTTGDTLGYCPAGYPTYKSVSSETCPSGKCYKNGYDCQKAGFGFCYTCSSCE